MGPILLFLFSQYVHGKFSSYKNHIHICVLYHEHEYFSHPLKVKCTLNVVLHVFQLAVKEIQDLAPYSVWQDVNAPMILYLMKKATNVSQLTDAVRLPYIILFTSLHTT